MLEHFNCCAAYKRMIRQAYRLGVGVVVDVLLLPAGGRPKPPLDYLNRIIFRSGN